MQFAMTVRHQRLSSKRPFCKNRLSDCHTFIVRRLILFSFKHWTNKTNCYVSQTEPMEVGRQHLKIANNSHCSFRSFSINKSSQLFHLYTSYFQFVPRHLLTTVLPPTYTGSSYKNCPFSFAQFAQVYQCISETRVFLCLLVFTVRNC